MVKICTSIQQSQKLIEIGIGTNTADMVYVDCEYLEIRDGVLEEGDIPAWSLVALLALIPITCVLSISNGYYRIASNETNTCFHNNPLDAAFDMICWLKENEKI